MENAIDRGMQLSQSSARQGGNILESEINFIESLVARFKQPYVYYRLTSGNYTIIASDLPFSRWEEENRGWLIDDSFHIFESSSKIEYYSRQDSSLPSAE